MDQVKAGFLWVLLFAFAMVFFTLAITGRLGIFVAIALTPDQVAVIGG